MSLPNPPHRVTPVSLTPTERPGVHRGLAQLPSPGPALTSPVLCPQYLLAMVLVYFRRAHLQLSEYTCSNLFLAL